jgi:hypothetical protein
VGIWKATRLGVAGGSSVQPSTPFSQRTQADSLRLRGSLFDAINAELDPGICDKMPLLEGFSIETVAARWGGA